MIKYLCSGRRGPLTPRAHREPAGDLQNPKHPCRNAGAPGGNAADGVRRQRPDLHLHLPVHLQGLQQHADGAAAPPGQVRLRAAGGAQLCLRWEWFLFFNAASLSPRPATGAWTRTEQTPADIGARRTTLPSESEPSLRVSTALASGAFRS